MPLISASTLNSRFSQLVVATVLLLGVAWFLVPSFGIERHLHVPGIPTFTNSPPQTRPDHPIDHLVLNADAELQVLLRRETKDVHTAAQAYRDRRGRQPPPGFDRWFAFAQNKSALIVEDFFDQIYHDLRPFWGVPAKHIREQANDHEHRISVRNGNVTQRSDIPREWLDLWQDLVQTVAQDLPDVDLAINEMDESRVIVPWEEITGYVDKERATRRIVPEGQLKDTYHTLASLDKMKEAKVPPAHFDPEFQRMGPYWPLAVIGCPPGSPARNAYIETDFTKPPPLSGGWPEGSYKGYVQNWTLAKSPCDNAHLQGLHGTFVEPISIANTKKFIPLFGGSKLPMNNEILLPAAMYWTKDPFYSGGKEHGDAWSKKKSAVVWRGAASGGRNTNENWTRFQRHRFVSMINATSVHTAEAQPEVRPPNFVLDVNNTYALAAQSETSKLGDLSKWIGTWSNAAVVHLLCFPGTGTKYCPYTDPYFTVETTIPMAEQYSYKYLPDIDGNSFSGRYRGFLGSTSLPIKATIYQEWHDSRLVPWKHFVPMDNTFADFYGIMEYFIGNANAGMAGHDDVAEAIAMSGKAWTERVLRREDMQIYVFRLLLEYARLCDDDRDVLGWREGKAVGNDLGI